MHADLFRIGNFAPVLVARVLKVDRVLGVVLAEQIPILLLVSLTMSAYAWTYDYVVLLPAVVHGLVFATRAPRNRAWYKNSAVVLYVITNVLYLGLRFVLLSDYYFFWFAPALLVIYLISANASSRPFVIELHSRGRSC